MPNDSYFQGNPIRLDTSRCRFNRKPRWTGSWNVGRLVPIYANSLIMPGDTLSVSVASAIRMTTPVFPVMDDMDITIEAYFVPHRLTLSRKSMSPDVNDSNHSWSAFIGAQDSLLNMPTPGDVKLPTMQVENYGYIQGGLGDCLGMPKPTNSSTVHYDVNALKILAYASIWNEYFREPSTRSPVTYSISGGEVYVQGTDLDASWNGTRFVQKLLLAQVSRYHGYFGSALPWPQRNTASVELPLGDAAPVITGADIPDASLAGNPVVKFAYKYNGSAVTGDGTVTSAAGGMALDGTGTGGTSDLVFKNLYADLSTATAATVNQFRLAVQTQRWYEHLARSGNKYSDLINGMYGIRIASTQDRPEYLGGFTSPISISQVAATTAATGQDLGKTGAFSLSNPSGFLFQKSFTEHGTVMIVACCRVRDSFCQGISRQDTKVDRFDFYWPEFANLGEQPIFEKEIFVTGVSGLNDDDKVFGYQEAWAEYRMDTPDLVTGYAKPTATNAISYLTYCNNFSTAPDLKGFLDASAQTAIVDNTLAVGSSAAGFQLYGQFQFDCNWVRPMPLYSIPGLVDHH